MKNYHIITYGCQMNESDSERIAGQLENRMYQLTKDPKLADLVIINVCSVRQSAINRVYSRVEKIRRQNRHAQLILTGCILEKDKKQLSSQVDKIWPIVDFKIKAKCKSSRHAFIPIMTGCNNFCSYCVVPYTRDRERSRQNQEIIKETKDLIEQGQKEITLLGQNVNSYHDKSSDFPQLLRDLNDLEGNFKLNFLTSHPKDMSDKLIETIAKSDKVSKEIHLPVQSGDDQILKKMNRGYSIKDYKNLIRKIRKEISDAKISTDIIVGFPSETEKQFQNTIKLIKQIKFSQAYIASYSPRTGTQAAKLKDNVPSFEKKRRKTVLLKMFK